MKTTNFAIDFLDGKTFPGHTMGESWNGFACPYFSFEQARQVMEAWREQGLSAWYDANADAFTFEMSAGQGEKSYDSFPASMIEGLKLYPIGAFGWIWEEMEEQLR